MEREMDLRGKEAVSLSSLVKQEYQIPDSYYFGEVKRGLRNSDGTGVLIGVTKVGSVQGYLIEDGRRIPAPASSIIAALTSTRSSKRTARAAHLATRRSRICCSWGTCRQNPSFPILTISCAGPESCPRASQRG